MRGPQDPRLGKIDVVLLSHVHSDHPGDAIQPAANARECGKPDLSVSVTPNSNTVNIAVAKKGPDRGRLGGWVGQALAQNGLTAYVGPPRATS